MSTIRSVGLAPAFQAVALAAALASRTVSFTGDLILGWGSTYVPPDGGSLAAYLDSLRLVRSRRPDLLCPGHGPWITDAAGKIEEYIAYRQDRKNAFFTCLERSIRSRMELLYTVWSDVPEILRPAAAVGLEAHLQKLEAEGRYRPSSRRCGSRKPISCDVRWPRREP